MTLNLIARKLGMSHIHTDEGVFIPLTMVKLYDNCVLDMAADEGSNIRIGFGKLEKSKEINKPIAGIFNKKKIPVHRRLCVSKVSKKFEYKIGDSINVSSILSVGDLVSVSGASIGKGFAGAMKRHNFGGLEASHGISISHRSHGSTGQCQDPGKVFKGKKMAGHMGNEKVTIKNLKVVDIDNENNIVAFKGSIPGSSGKDVILKIDY